MSNTTHLFINAPTRSIHRNTVHRHTISPNLLAVSVFYIRHSASSTLLIIILSRCTTNVADVHGIMNSRPLWAPRPSPAPLPPISHELHSSTSSTPASPSHSRLCTLPTLAPPSPSPRTPFPTYYLDPHPTPFSRPQFAQPPWQSDDPYRSGSRKQIRPPYSPIQIQPPTKYTSQRILSINLPSTYPKEHCNQATTPKLTSFILLM